MKAVFSGSGFASINWVDVGKSLRVGLFALVGAFATGAVGAASQLNVTTVMTDPRPAIAAVILAGITTVFDLIRRYLTDYSAS